MDFERINHRKQTKMTSRQIIVNNDQEQGNRSFFTERLAYHLHGAHQCLSLLQGSNQSSEEQLLELTQQLVKKIEVLIHTQNHQTQMDRDQPEELETFRNGLQQPRLESRDQELNLAKRGNKDLMKANRKLKKRIRSLETRIDNLKIGLIEYSKLAEITLKLNKEESLEETDTSEAEKEIPESKTSKAMEDTSLETEKESNESKSNNPPEYLKKTQNKAIQVESQTQEIEIQSSAPTTPKKHKTVKISNNNLENQVQALHQAYLRSASSSIRNLSLVTQNYYDLKRNAYLGGDCTLLAIKAHDSFLVFTYKKGLLLLRNGKQLYTGAFKKILKDLIYIKDYNAYFFCAGAKIYRKDEDGNRPYPIIDISCGYRMAAAMRYSEINKRLIVNSLGGSAIAVMNLDTKEIEVVVKDPLGPSQSLDFSLLGENEDRVISARKDDRIMLYRFDYTEQKGEITSRVPVPLLEGRKEQIKALAVCTRREYVFIEIGQKFANSLCSRMILARVIGDTLTMVGKLDLFSQKLGFKMAFECYGYVGNHILWAGLTKKENGKIQVFDFDTETQDLKELKDRRISQAELNPAQLKKLGQDFYYIGYQARLQKLMFQF